MTRTVIPMISYEDVGAAIPWLEKAFGFREELRFADSRGTVTHAEMVLGDGVIMLGNPGPHYQGPRRHRQTCKAAHKWSAVPFVIDGVHVYVDDVEAHFRRAKAAGATMLSGVEDTPFGDRHYRVEDLEGHRWMFGQHDHDVTPEQWGATAAKTR